MYFCYTTAVKAVHSIYPPFSLFDHFFLLFSFLFLFFTNCTFQTTRMRIRNVISALIHIQICKWLTDRDIYLNTHSRHEIVISTKICTMILLQKFSSVHVHIVHISWTQMNLWPNFFHLEARLANHGTKHLISLILLSLPCTFIHLLLHIMSLLFLLSIFPFYLFLMFLLLALLLNLTFPIPFPIFLTLLSHISSFDVVSEDLEIFILR